jgi:hypothetical protein
MKRPKSRKNGIAYGIAFDELSDDDAQRASDISDYLRDLIAPEQLKAVQKMLGMIDGDDPSDAPAMDSLPQRLRQETLDRQRKDYNDRFPNAQRLK